MWLKKLYSIKVTRELKPLSFFKGGTFYGVRYEPGYKLSVNGRRRRYTMDYLESLLQQMKFKRSE